jgi:hypothetical protein
LNKNGRLNNYILHVSVMNSSSIGTPCDCQDEQHKEKNVNHKHIGDECIHEDGTKHKLHQPAH